MDALAAAFREIRQIRDDECVRALLLDCYEYAQDRGEAEGLALAAVIRAGVEAFDKHERFVQSLTTGAGGAVLGEAPPPVVGEWWALLPCGRVVPASDRRANDAVYWCDSAAGWHRVPGKAEGRAVA